MIEKMDMKEEGKSGKKEKVDMRFIVNNKNCLKKKGQLGYLWCGTCRQHSLASDS